MAGLITRTTAPLLMVFLVLLAPSACLGQAKEPAVSGTFYPSEENQLRQMVNRFLEKADRKNTPGRLIALISPHAGLQYSGEVAAHAYRQIKGMPVRTVYLIGPSHHERFAGVALYPGTGMRTPLGTVRINEEATRELVDENAGVRYITKAFDREHSLEVQLPFLQTVLKDFSIVPILISSPTRQSFNHLTQKLAERLRSDDRSLLVVSTDLSHYHDDVTASVMDHRVLDAIERLSVSDLERGLSKKESEMCGGFPVIYALALARNLGATNGVLFKYANSGDSTGDRRSVVGYAAMGIYRSPLTKEQREELLALARNTVTAQVNGQKLPDPVVTDPRLKADGATFVTVNTKDGHLRGCIGNMMPDMPLYKSVITNAVSASSRDPRFPPVKPAELKNLTVEVTVLSPMEPMREVSEIELGVHGVYMEKDGRSAVFLPQVATEQGWDVPTMMQQLARKAGLPHDGWKGAQFQKFTAEIIKP